ncbi:MAG: chromosome segregation protein SMC [Phycisphaerales bacterium]|nr:MAG: chromosome segregation protein SMC [Phycisphaerales bacterium]
MRLVRLTLSGFKSFADKTEFTFDAPITGIVGPNGCGKSNVVDAIKWVLGERSAKSLRGKEMGDVIFAGSAGRKPMGLASVTLTFENPLLDDAPPAWRVTDALRAQADAGVDEPNEPDAPDAQDETPDADDGSPVVDGEHEAELNGDRPFAQQNGAGRKRSLPIDTETVDIERRLHRDGTSEYLINGRKARLRDIRDLFMDTGVGADAYSIIEQGKVDAMLLASNIERRTIFEEAAGVARFRARRVEAQRKLERTEMNLVRAREQLESTERRLRIVKGQAAKARRFQELDARLLELRTALAFDQYHDLRERLSGLTSRLASLEETRREAGERLLDIEDERQRAELERHELGSQRQELESERAGAEHTRQRAEQRRDMSARAIEEVARRLEGEERRLREATEAIEKLQASVETQRAQIESLEAGVAQAETAHEDATRRRSEAQSELAEARSTLDERRVAVTDVERKRAALLSEAEAERRRAEALRDQSSRLRERGASMDDAAKSLRTDLEAASRASAERESKAGELERDAASLDNDSSALVGDQRTLSERLNEQEQELVRVESRCATLHEMIETRAGLGEAARAVLDRRDEGDASCACVVAPLAEMLRVQAEDAPAVEAALGRALQALVVDSLSSLSSSGALADLPGRVVFLPLHGVAAPIAPDPCADSLALPPHSLVPVRSLVEADVRVRDALDGLLSRTYLVPDLDSAMMLAAGPMSSLRARFVTRAGEVLEPDGRVLAGPIGGEESGRGLLQRRAEHVELETLAAGLRSRIESERVVLRRLDEQAAALDARRAEVRSAIAEERRALAANDARRDRLDAELSRLDREREGVHEELREIDGRLETLESGRTDLVARADKLEGLLEEQTALLEEAQACIARLQARVDEANEAVTHARVEVGQRSEQLSQARRELREIENNASEAARRAEHAQEQQRECVDRMGAHERAVEEAGVEIERAVAACADAATRIEAMQGDLLRAAERSRELSERLNESREHAQHVERDWQSLEISRRELEVRRETLEERTQDDIGLDLPGAYAAWAADASEREPVDTGAMTAEAEEIKTEIRRLGNVNLDAIEEESNLESRNEDLIKQVGDIDEARAMLEELIDRLNNASRDRFRETFETIQANFAGKDGMFRKLFGGGKAELRLIPHPETGEIDWLESGVDVVAKPPGKEPRTIAQLSGGEKTMTAVALLMAIFQSKPSPFCVLDEVDAALDEANVGRFCAVVRQFLDRSHFIVITHNKRTMHEADLLYGVTMPERGVSRRVSVRFEDIGPAGQIKRTAADAAPSDDEGDAENDDPSPQQGSLRPALAAMRGATAPASAGADD